MKNESNHHQSNESIIINRHSIMRYWRDRSMVMGRGLPDDRRDFFFARK